MRAEELFKFRKVLIIRLSSLGDILLSTPLVRSIKNQFPNLTVDFLLRQEFSDALVHNPHINRIIKFTRDEKENLITISQIAETGYDLIIDLQNNLRSKKIRKGAGSKSVSFNKKGWQKFLLVKFKINLLKSEKQIPVRCASSIQGLELDSKGTELFLDSAAGEIIPGNEKLIGFCPGAHHFTKRWPQEYFTELGRLLTGAGYRVVLFGGKTELELCSQLSKEIPDSINFSNSNELLKTAAGMKLCKGIICNDSGLMHTASALRIPLIAIFGSTVKEFGFTPYKCKNLILENNSLICRPCSHIGRKNCPESHFKCMTDITPEFVFGKTKAFLDHI